MNQFISGMLMMALFIGFYFYVFIPQWRLKHKPRSTPQLIAFYDLVITQINSCKNYHQLDCCDDLILLFDRWFQNQIHPDILNEKVDNLFNRLITKRDSLYISEQVGNLVLS